MLEAESTITFKKTDMRNNHIAEMKIECVERKRENIKFDPIHFIT